MALISCPECGKEVSDQANACVRCGYPLAAAGRSYTLVLLEAGAYPDVTAKVLAKHLTLSVEAAGELLSRAPAVLAQGLTRREALEVSTALGKVCRVKAVPDRDAVSPEDALRARPAELDRWAARPLGLPLTFRQTVGAILTALALWTLITWLLAGLLGIL